MINNRQAGRRNRGRNNGRQSGGNRGGENGNRIDNRARGNAPQLLEKYRNMARDAQLAGDRVNTEYYLQFADHYFRVIADNRARQDARQDDQQVRFRRNDESLDDDFEQDEVASVGESQRDASESDEQRGRRNRNDRHPQPQSQRQHRYEPRPARSDSDQSASVVDAPVREIAVREPVERQAPTPDAVVEKVEASVEAPAPKRRGRPPRVRADIASQGETQPGIDLAALPPAIARADNDSDAGEVPAPRRRGRPRRAAAEAAE